MTAFDDMEEDIRRREDAVKARELKMRLKEIEKELEAIPKQPVDHGTAQSVEAEVVSEAKNRSLFRKAKNVGMFGLIVVSVIVAVKIATWVATILMVLGITWMSYKLFLESKD